MPFLYSAPVAPPKAQPQADVTTVAATVAAMALITGLFVVYTRQPKASTKLEAAPSILAAPSIEAAPSTKKSSAAPPMEATQTQVPSQSMEALSTAMTNLKAAI